MFIEQVSAAKTAETIGTLDLWPSNGCWKEILFHHCSNNGNSLFLQ